MTNNNLLSEGLSYTGDSQTPTHVHLCSYNVTDVESHNCRDFDEMLSLLRPDAINWIQVHGLRDTKLVQDICCHFGIEFLLTQDILNAEHLTKIEVHDRYNAVILKHLLPRTDGIYGVQQLCIVQGADFILTFTEMETDFFDDVYAALRNNVLKIRSRHSDYLLSVLLNSVMTNYMSVISQMEDELEDLEECFLSTKPEQQPGIDVIQLHRRNFRLIKKSVLPLKEQLGRLFYRESALLHKASRPFFNDVNDHLQFVLQTLEGCRDMLSSLVDLYLSNNDQRMNSIMKQLTIVSTIFIPLTFLAGIWGMNFHWMPELEWRYGYFVAWGLMVCVAVFVFVYLKYKKWS